MSTAGVVAEVAAERRRQQRMEGWSEFHDDGHDDEQLAAAAACYAYPIAKPQRFGTTPARVPMGWPWDEKWWKPKDRRRDLIRAAALIVAEVERLDRAAVQGDDGRSVQCWKKDRNDDA